MSKIQIDTSQYKNKNDSDLDIDLVRKEMIKGVILTESVLFSQASFEHKRIDRSRKLISKLEEFILKEEFIDSLDISQKVNLYKLLNANQTESLNFLHRLHSNVATAIDTLNKVEKVNLEKQERLEEKESPEKDDIKNLISLIIKKREKNEQS